MSDGSISQDEIDALLSGVSMSGAAAPSSGSGNAGLSDFKKNALLKFVNGNIPGLSSNLESMSGKSVSISEPIVEMTEREGFLQNISEMAVASLIDFSGTLSGDHVFVMPPDLAQKIVNLVNHEEGTEIDDMALSVISETVSQYAGTELTSLERSGLSGVVSSPAESLHVPKAMIRLPQRNFISITYNIQLDNSAYKFWEVISESAADAIINATAGPDPAAQAQDMMTGGGAGAASQAMGGFAQGMQGMQNGFQNFGGAAQGMPQGGMMPMQGMQGGMAMQNMGMNASVQPVQFPPLQGFVTQEEQGNIGLIMDVYMEMTVELGRTKKMIKEILGMGEGHIIELDKLAGEPVDVLVNHKPIAKGEVVVIEENFGVRITEILSPAERIADV
ncbi:flagellar motor switch protein FliN [Treponema pedis]|uniref:Flagellar motor switch protein FliN n=1 Tax=Treponema pedis TaxID=409322 RepID=A0A7S7AW98_9SPIR|nr:flagellar motor switch protein FliN [Treponema pedis]QOW60667.1 flagellar motor switch protein FliN [Treponema pedis]